MPPPSLPKNQNSTSHAYFRFYCYMWYYITCNPQNRHRAFKKKVSNRIWYVCQRQDKCTLVCKICIAETTTPLSIILLTMLNAEQIYMLSLTSVYWALAGVSLVWYTTQKTLFTSSYHTALPPVQFVTFKPSYVMPFKSRYFCYTIIYFVDSIHLNPHKYICMYMHSDIW